MKLGEILIKEKKMCKEELNFMLSVQKKEARDRRLGHILLDFEIIKPEELLDTLKKQKRYRRIGGGNVWGKK